MGFLILPDLQDVEIIEKYEKNSQDTGYMIRDKMLIEYLSCIWYPLYCIFVFWFD